MYDKSDSTRSVSFAGLLILNKKV